MAAPTHVRARSILEIGAWAGLAAGVVESLIGIGMRVGGRAVRVPLDILWVAPAFDFLLFLAAAAALALVTAPRPLARFRPLIVVALLWMFAWDVIQAINFVSPASGLILGLGLAVAAYRARPGFEPWATLARRVRLPIAAAAAACVLFGIVYPQWKENRFLAAVPMPATRLPNVLVITLDTLRADHLSAYGYSRSTPNLDALARRGVLFEHAIANSSWTLPSHGSLLTGRYPHEHGGDWLRPVDPRVTSIAEVLAPVGYVTGAFAANTSYVTPEWGLGKGFSHFDAYGDSLDDKAVRTAYGRRLALNLLPRIGYYDIPGRRRADRLNDALLGWIDRIDVGRPFFALVNYLDVHDPYLTGAPYQTRYSQDAARGDVINFQFQPRAFRRKARVSPAEIQAEIDAYDGCLAFLDHEIGFLVAELQERGLANDTLIVLTSDHGEAFGNHDLFGHGNSLYFETLHVPLMVVWPGHVPEGARVSQVAGLNRIPATILELLGRKSAPGAAEIPGSSLAPLWTPASTAITGQPVLSEVTGVLDGPAGYPTTSGTLASLVTDEWHFVTTVGGASQLFAWRDDPDEQTDLSATPRGQAVTGELRDLLQKMRGTQP